MIILIPMPIFLQSTLTLKRKMVLCGVFAVGTFTVCLTSSFLLVEVDRTDTIPRSRSSPPS